MQKIDDLDKRFLRFVLTGDIAERHAGLLFHIDLGLALADAADGTKAAGSAAAARDDEAHEQAEQRQHQQWEQHPREQERERAVLDDLAAELHLIVLQRRNEGRQIHIGQQAGVIHGAL